MPKGSRKFLVLSQLLLLILIATAVAAQTTHYPPDADQIPGPDCLNPVKPSAGQQKICSPEDYKAWLEDITHWRMEARIRAGYSGQEYERPELKWTQSSFIQPQMMVEDRYFYDPEAGHYTVDQYLDDLDKRYGGIDSVLIWPVYPNIGIDNRNQYDLVRDMPGVSTGVQADGRGFSPPRRASLLPVMAVGPGHARSRRAELGSHGEADGGNRSRRRQRRYASGHCRAPSGQLRTDGPSAGARAGARLPVVLRSACVEQHDLGLLEISDCAHGQLFKWLEPRHMVNVCDRWDRDKTDNLQYAFFNGVGYESWENIWGIWNQITPRDAEALRRVATIERAYGRIPDKPGLAALRRHACSTGVYASRWPQGKSTLWTMVNRNQYDVDGRQLRSAMRRRDALLRLVAWS